MVTALKAEGGAQLPSTNLQKTIQSLQELTGNHSDTEVYAALKDCHMDVNEAAQKLLNQGLFHEVRRKRDKKKENAGFKDLSDHRKRTENANHTQNAGFKDLSDHRKRTENTNPTQNAGLKDFSDHRKRPENANHTQIAGISEFSDHRKRTENANHTQHAGFKDFSEHRMRTENANHTAKFYHAERNFTNVRRGPFSRNNIPKAAQPVSKNLEFRVVRDNRVNQNPDKETKPAVSADPASDNHSAVANVSEKSASSNNYKPSSRAYISQSINRVTDSRPKFTRDINLSGHRKEQSEEKRATVPNSVSHPQTDKEGDSQSRPTSSLPSSTCVEGVYASASDPVHVPSPNSRSPAMKREVGVVGGHRQSVESSSRQPSHQSSSNSNLVQGSTSTTGSFRSINNGPKKDLLSSFSVPQSAMVNTNRAFLNQHHTTRQYQPLFGQQKGALPSKEWRPKSSQMAKVSTPRGTGTSLKSASPSDNAQIDETDPAQLHDELSQVSIQKVQNVVIAQHIRVPENDRYRLTFGSFGVDPTSTQGSTSGLPATGGRESTIASGSDEIFNRKQLNPLDDRRNSGSSSPTDVPTEQQIPDEEQTVSSLQVERYSDTGFGRENSPPFSASESQQHQDASDLSNFAAYDPQTGYDISYFRHVEDTERGQTLPSHQEVLTSHSANSIPSSSMAMLQQQPPLTQMYPQVHVSHFANVMPYRQFLSPVYVPPMGLPGYSNNPTYAQPPNGSSYVLMPGGSSHLAPGNMKFGVQQFKPVPTVSASSFGNFGGPTGYTINAPGIVGSATGLEDSSRLKYKDSNLYVPSPQAETSEVWIQNPRDLAGMQSAQYYNIQGQGGHPAYMQSHTSFNPSGVAQSSHVQFPGGVYHHHHHQQPPSVMANAHHMAAQMGGAAAGPQVGAYQQQAQHGHLNWTTNF